MSNVDFIHTEFNVPLRQRILCSTLNALDKLTRWLEAPSADPGDLDQRQAIIQFIRFKDILDLTLENSGGYRYAFQCTTPFEYLRFMLPGFEFSYTEAASVRDEVDPEMVIGCPWQGYSPPPDPESIMERLNLAKLGSPERARYGRVGNLPLFVAQEGKNRVQLFQRHRRSIHADVREIQLTYIPRVYRNCSGIWWLASWENEYGERLLAAIPFPALTIPMYRALGAQILGERIPADEGSIIESNSQAIQSLIEAVAMP